MAVDTTKLGAWTKAFTEASATLTKSIAPVFVLMDEQAPNCYRVPSPTPKSGSPQSLPNEAGTARGTTPQWLSVSSHQPANVGVTGSDDAVVVVVAGAVVVVVGSGSGINAAIHT
jgi:hypothetical protein